jgi:hypothetical protein
MPQVARTQQRLPEAWDSVVMARVSRIDRSRSLVGAAMAPCDHPQLQHPGRARHQYQ